MLVNYRLFQSKKQQQKIEKKLKYVIFWSVRYTDSSQNAILKKRQNMAKFEQFRKNTNPDNLCDKEVK